MKTYNVIDVEINMAVFEGKTIPEISKHFGLSENYLQNMANTKEIFKKKYILDPIADIDGCQSLYKMPLKLQAEWDNVYKAAQLLKSGKGKIVTTYSHGKYKRHTEAIA